MPVERSAGAVVFRESGKGREYLLLHHHEMADKKRASRPVSVGHWSFPKGHVEKGETTEQTVRREVKEETGITKLELVPDFKETIRYFVNYDGQKRMKFVAFFLAKTNQKKITVSFEHQGFAWLSYEQAIVTVTYRSDKQILKAAEAFIKLSPLSEKEHGTGRDS